MSAGRFGSRAETSCAHLPFVLSCYLLIKIYELIQRSYEPLSRASHTITTVLCPGYSSYVYILDCAHHMCICRTTLITLSHVVSHVRTLHVKYKALYVLCCTISHRYHHHHIMSYHTVISQLSNHTPSCSHSPHHGLSAKEYKHSQCKLCIASNATYILERRRTSGAEGGTSDSFN